MHLFRKKDDRRSMTHIAAHENDKDTPSNVSVHSLLPREFQEIAGGVVNDFRILTIHLYIRHVVSGLYQRVAAPSSTHKPPFSFTLC